LNHAAANNGQLDDNCVQMPFSQTFQIFKSAFKKMLRATRLKQLLTGKYEWKKSKTITPKWMHGFGNLFHPGFVKLHSSI